MVKIKDIFGRQQTITRGRQLRQIITKDCKVFTNVLVNSLVNNSISIQSQDGLYNLDITDIKQCIV